MPQPYHAVAGQVGVTAEEVMARMQRMLEDGMIRRIGAVPNHYALGYKANGMTVWDVRTSASTRSASRSARWISSATATAARATCRTGPTTCSPWCTAATAPRWRTQVRRIAALLGDAGRGHEILYSTRILKKTGLRIGG